MAPVCPTNPSNPYVCWQGNYADWVSDFLQAAGQERLRQNDPRVVLDNYTMPSWCFLDNGNPDWRRQVPAVEQGHVQANSTPT